MNRLLFALLALCLSSHWNNVEALKLQNLCPNSTFKFEFTEVNAVHTIKFNRTLPKVGTYLFNETLTFRRLFSNKTYAKQMREYANQYNLVMMDLYSERFFNWCKVYQCDVFKQREYIIKYQKSIESLRRKVKDRYRPEFYEHLNVMRRGRRYIRLVRKYFKDTLQTSYFKLDEFRQLIEKLKINNSTETFVFQDQPISEIYGQPIKQFERFYFIRGSKSYYDFDSYGIVEMSINLPFFNKRWKPSIPCLQYV